MNTTKTLMAGLSLSLVLALSGCGTTTADGSTPNVQTAGTSYQSTKTDAPVLETRNGTTDENPINLRVEEVHETNVTLSFDGFTNEDAFNQANGVAIAYVQIPEDLFGDDYNVSDLNYVTEEHNATAADFWQKAHFGWHIKTFDADPNDGDTNRTTITVTELDPNTRYAFRISSMVTHSGLFGDPSTMIDTGLTLFSGTGNWDEITTQAKTLAIIPNVECLKGCCISWCDTSVTPNEKKYGAKLKWDLPSGVDTVKIYRSEWDNVSSAWIPDPAGYLATTSTGDTEYIDESAELNKKYKYVVKSVVGSTESSGKEVIVEMY